MPIADKNPLLRDWTGPYGLPPFREEAMLRKRGLIA